MRKACCSAVRGGNVKRAATLVESPGNRFSDAGSIPAISTKQVLDEHLFLQRRFRRKVFALIHNRKAPSWKWFRDGAFSSAGKANDRCRGHYGSAESQRPNGMGRADELQPRPCIRNCLSPSDLYSTSTQINVNRIARYFWQFDIIQHPPFSLLFLYIYCWFYRKFIVYYKVLFYIWTKNFYGCILL